MHLHPHSATDRLVNVNGRLIGTITQQYYLAYPKPCMGTTTLLPILEATLAAQCSMSHGATVGNEAE